MALYEQSQGPAPTPSKSEQSDQHQTAPKQAKAETDERISNKPMSGINQPPPNPAAANQKQPCTPQQESPPANWWSIASTILITIFTGALALLAWCQWRAMNRQAQYMQTGLLTSIKAGWDTRRAASAASRSAEALLNSERPWVVVDPLREPLQQLIPPRQGRTSNEKRILFSRLERREKSRRNYCIRFYMRRG